MIVTWQTEATLKTVTPIGILAFHAMRAALDAINVLTSDESNTLGLHIGIGASTVTGHHVGGILGRWEYYINGDACRQMNSAEGDAQTGQVVISSECYGHVNTCAQISNLQIQTVLLNTGRYILMDIEATVERLPAFRCRGSQLTSEMMTRICSYVPGSVNATIKAGGSTRNDASMRLLSVLFVSLHGILDIKDAQEQMDKVHMTFTNVQEAAYHVYGTIRQFIIDDKGAVAIAALGLPPLFHENNAIRAVKMAIRLREKGVVASIGITTGFAFCGSVGSMLRSEYAVVGDNINLAARFMGLAKPKEILIDQATKCAVEDSFRVDAGTNVTVKGQTQPVSMYRVLGASSTGHYATEDIDFPEPIGVENILKALNQLEDHALDWNRPQRSRTSLSGAETQTGKNAIFIHGDSGLGKTMLLKQLHRRKCTVLFGSADAVESDTPFFCLRPIISAILQAQTVSEVPIVDIPAQVKKVSAASLARRGAAGAVVRKPSAATVTLPTQVIERMWEFSQNDDDEDGEYSTGPDGTTLSAFSKTGSSKASSSSEKDLRLFNIVAAASAYNTEKHRFTRLLGTKSSVLQAILSRNACSAAILPLLNTIMPVDIPETTFTLSMTPDERDKGLFHLLKEMFVEVTSIRPVVLAFDDAHWMDEHSATVLLNLLLLSVPSRVYTVLSLRQDKGTVTHAPSLLQLKRLPSSLSFDLTRFTKRETGVLFSTHFGISVFDAGLLEFVQTKSNGVPATIVSLLQHMIESGTIGIDRNDGTAKILKPLENVNMAISEHVRAKVTSLMDSLSGSTQNALRIASACAFQAPLSMLVYVRNQLFQNANFVHAGKNAGSNNNGSNGNGNGNGNGSGSGNNGINSGGNSNSNSNSYGGKEDARGGGAERKSLHTIVMKRSTIVPDTSSTTKQTREMATLMMEFVDLMEKEIVLYSRGSDDVRFADSSVRQVVYTTMLNSQRQAIHECIILWYEKECPAFIRDQFKTNLIMGEHLLSIGNYVQALERFTLGAEQHMLSGCVEDSLACLNHARMALEGLDRQGKGSPDEIRMRYVNLDFFFAQTALLQGDLLSAAKQLRLLIRHGQKFQTKKPSLLKRLSFSVRKSQVLTSSDVLLKQVAANVATSRTMLETILKIEEERAKHLQQLRTLSQLSISRHAQIARIDVDGSDKDPIPARIQPIVETRPVESPKTLPLSKRG